MNRIRVQYTSDEERMYMLEQYAHLFLIEEQNITEGNFLVFSDTIPNHLAIETRVEKLEDENAMFARELAASQIVLEQTQQEQATLILALVESEVI